MLKMQSEKQKAAVELRAIREEFIIKNPPTLRAFLSDCVAHGYGVGRISGKMVKTPDYFRGLSPREQAAVYKDVERAAMLLDHPFCVSGEQVFIPSTTTAMVLRAHPQKKGGSRKCP
jgi:hypothetical protein